ncbi:MAG: hypothetical protein COB93_12095 [Sneathiella sp.]|nr:MAG: hypothetical protein COB93_12095 [Sneathiella sp.]
MRYAATLLVVSDSPDNGIEPCLSEAGYACTRLSFIDMFEKKFGNDAFDAIIIDGDNNDAEFDVKRIAEVADDHDFPILIIGPADVKCHAQTISTGYCELELLCRVGALIRLENMQQELQRRMRTTASYGIDFAEVTAPETELGDTHILIIGGKSIVLGNILLRLDNRAKIRICTDTENAVADLRANDYDAVIFSGVGQGDVNLRLTNDIRCDARLYNIPLIMVLENPENREAAYIHGVSDIVLHETEMDALINRTSLQILQYRYRAAMQKLFRLTKPHPIADGPTDLYSAGFMQPHFADMFGDHEDRQKVLSVASFKITNLDALIETHGFPSGDQLLRQVGSILFNLVRGEDFCGCYKKGHFVVALPGTRRQEAKIALRRIVGVVTNTEFAISSSPYPIQADVFFGLTEVEAGDTVEDVITRGFVYKRDDEQAA